MKDSCSSLLGVPYVLIFTIISSGNVLLLVQCQAIALTHLPLEKMNAILEMIF